MGRYSSIAVIAITVLALTGCSSSEQASTPTPNPTPTSTAAAIPSQAFSNPVVPTKPQATGVVATVATPNLIQSTNPIQRAGDVAKGRPDPFAQIIATPPPVIVNTVATVPRRPVPALPPLARATTVSVRPRIRSAVISSRVQTPYVSVSRIPKKAIAIAKLPKPMPGSSFTPVLPRVMPQIVPNPTLVSVLPPTPKPELAQAVAVTGVVMVGRDPQAIIKVPTEPTSRYVQAGDRLSSGLLVKRIEMNEGSEPIVIFEQFGIEVARMVGEGAAAPTTVSAGAVPPPPPEVSTGAS
jgi:hypothetical protein